MSTTAKRIPYATALTLAQSILDELEPYCFRIAIAGSLRRRKADIGDIEIVAIPNKVGARVNLFGESMGTRNLLLEYLDTAWGGRKIKGGEHYRQYDDGGINLDLFITTPAQWGMIYMIRTGSADFTRRMVTPRQQGGLMPSIFHVKDGRLWNGREMLDTPEETDIFRLYRMVFVKPEDRK